MTDTTQTRELVITRVVDATCERVWKAWTDPEQLSKWWGPKHFTSPVNKLDVRVGGTFLSCMRDPDGKDYWSTGIYKEVVANEKLVMTDNFSDKDGNIVPASYYGMPGDKPADLLITVTFEDAGEGKTKLTLRHSGLPVGEFSDQTEVGWNESLDKLQTALKEG
jgi:uncharacterized protein YndB with AHSA1/START domain